MCANAKERAARRGNAHLFQDSVASQGLMQCFAGHMTTLIGTPGQGSHWHEAVDHGLSGQKSARTSLRRCDKQHRCSASASEYAGCSKQHRSFAPGPLTVGRWGQPHWTSVSESESVISFKQLTTCGLLERSPTMRWKQPAKSTMCHKSSKPHKRGEPRPCEEPLPITGGAKIRNPVSITTLLMWGPGQVPAGSWLPSSEGGEAVHWAFWGTTNGPRQPPK